MLTGARAMLTGPGSAGQANHQFGDGGHRRAMANWHLVVAYDEGATDWLAAQGYRHPPARPGNRLPTEAEIAAAVRALGIGPDALLVDGAGGADSFRVRGDMVAELRLLRLLSERAGQVWAYPDCGSPAVVVDPATDPEAVAAAWLRSLDAPDPWAAFLGRTSDAEPGAPPDRGGM